jgi:hypothetical protein
VLGKSPPKGFIPTQVLLLFLLWGTIRYLTFSKSGAGVSSKSTFSAVAGLSRTEEIRVTEQEFGKIFDSMFKGRRGIVIVLLAEVPSIWVTSGWSRSPSRSSLGSWLSTFMLE